MQPKFYLILFLSNEQKHYSFNEIDAVLKGETLNTPHNKKTSTYKTSDYTCNATYVGNDNISNEINLVFNNTNIDSCYNLLNSYYNTYFNSTNYNKKFNSWSTDSLEVLLFKQTDSAILVNIFIKTYR